MEHESDCDPNGNRCARYSRQRISIWIERIGNKNTNGDHPNDSTVKIRQNTEKSPGDVRRLADTQTPMKDHQPLIGVKTLKGIIIIK